MVFAFGSGSAAPALEALAGRLSPESRADAMTVLRIVRQRGADGG